MANGWAPSLLITGVREINDLPPLEDVCRAVEHNQALNHRPVNKCQGGKSTLPAQNGQPA
jgi:hypothetical protein